MWKKPFSDRANEPQMPSVAQAKPSVTSQEKALVGPSIVITGGLAGEEDVCIQGRVEGTVEFKGYSVTIGKHGRVKADIYAREICVEGQLEGNLFAEERVEVRVSGRILGNIEAPRVVMADGALFKGAIDMSKRESVKSDSPQHKETLSRMPPSAKGIVGDQSKVSVGTNQEKTGTEK